MYPREHAIVSAVTVALYSVFTGLTPSRTLLWIVLGVMAGVFVDADHLVLAFFAGKRREVLGWSRKPFKALTNPESLVEDLEDGYSELYHHRLISHITIIAVVLIFYNASVLLEPVAVALIAHLMCDVLWDVHEGNYDSKVVNKFRE